MNTRWVRSFLVALAILLSLAPASAIHADPPTFETVDMGFDSVLPAVQTGCSFDITQHVEGVMNIQYFWDDGALVRIRFHSNARGQYSNPLSGKSLDYIIASNQTWVPNSDGSETLTSTGVLGRIVVPGEGLVTAQVGRIVLLFNPTQTVIFEAGMHERPFPKICSYLE